MFPKGKNTELLGYKTVYWIEAARASEKNQVIATVAEMRIGGKHVWDFKRATENSLEVLLQVDSTGNVNFVAWLGEVPAPQLDTTLITFDASNRHHFAYAKQEHQQFALSSGRTLLSYSQNWDDVKVGEFKTLSDGSIDWKAYRPIFTEEPLKSAFRD